MHNNFNYRKGSHFHNFTHYERFADYDTNSVSYYDYLAKVNKYLHYIDHLLCELQDILNDILERLADLEDKVNVLEMYMHVPSKLELKLDTMHLLKVSNVNRTHSDGLDEKLEDIHNQLHLIDVSELEKVIKDLKIRVENLEHKVTNLENRVNHIENEINKIWNYLNNLANPKYHVMSEHTDYEIVYRNGYSGNLEVSYVDMGNYYTIRIRSLASRGKLNNPNLKNTRFQHGNTPNEVTQSVIVQIKFKNNFAHLNSKRYMSANGGTHIWTTHGSNQPTSWGVEVSMWTKYNNFANSSWNNYAITLTSFGINDGYNTQYNSAGWYSNANPLNGTSLDLDSQINVIL